MPSLFVSPDTAGRIYRFTAAMWSLPAAEGGARSPPAGPGLLRSAPPPFGSEGLAACCSGAPLRALSRCPRPWARAWGGPVGLRVAVPCPVLAAVHRAVMAVPAGLACESHSLVCSL